MVIAYPVALLLGSLAGYLLKPAIPGWLRAVLAGLGIGVWCMGEWALPISPAAVWIIGLAALTIIGFCYPLFGWFWGFEAWFARRIAFRAQRSISGLVVRLGLVSIALGVAVMEISLSIVFGFQAEIHQKVVGFGGHLTVGNLFQEYENERDPLPRYGEFVEEIAQMPSVVNIQPYATKPALIRSKTDQEGVFLKGVDGTFNWQFFDRYLKQGQLPDLTKGQKESNEILISERLAQLLDVQVGEKILAYFYEEKMRVRQLTVTGTYETGMEEFDLLRVICDLRMVQRIWGWEEDEVEGFEVNLHQLDDLYEAQREVNYLLPTDYECRTVTQMYPEIFEWVELQHQNVWFILALMIIISIINMTSVILILILERTRTIGLLKALGLTNAGLRKVFVLNAMWLILIGIAMGNILGLTILWTQDAWGWLQVDQANYFVNIVPVKWTWDWFLVVNLGVFAVCTLFMYIPTHFATKVSPVKSLRFD